MKHRFWHFIYGEKIEDEVLIDEEDLRTSNFWYVCKKCNHILSEKQGITTFTIGNFIVEKES